MAKVDKRRRELVRLKQPTQDLLRQIREQSVLHYASLDVLVRELAEQRLERLKGGIPHRRKKRQNRGGVTNPQAIGRSPRSEAPRRSTNLVGGTAA